MQEFKQTLTYSYDDETGMYGDSNDPNEKNEYFDTESPTKPDNGIKNQIQTSAEGELILATAEHKALFDHKNNHFDTHGY